MAELKVPSRFETLAVIGNGIIGHGVAQLFAMAGKKVVLVGRASDSLERALKRIRASLDDFVAHQLLERAAIEPIMRRITPTTRLADAAAAELVIEAVTEDLALKRDLFGRLDKICPPPAVLASSSGQPASALIAEVEHARAGHRGAFLVSAAAHPAGRDVWRTADPIPRWWVHRERPFARPARSRSSSIARSPGSSATGCNSRCCARPGRCGPPAPPGGGDRCGGAQQLRPPGRRLPGRSSRPMPAGLPRCITSAAR